MNILKNKQTKVFPLNNGNYIEHVHVKHGNFYEGTRIYICNK